MSQTFEINPPTIYRIDIESIQKGNYTNAVYLNGKKGFTNQNQQRGAKIYMVVCGDFGGTVNYVGKTIQPMGKRLYQGLNKQQYRWTIGSAAKKFLFVWDVTNHHGPMDSEDLSCLEAELAYAVRVNQLAWPIDLKTISFEWHNSASKRFYRAQTIALEMMQQYYDFLVREAKLAGEDSQVLIQDHQRLQNILLDTRLL